MTFQLSIIQISVLELLIVVFVFLLTGYIFGRWSSGQPIAVPAPERHKKKKKMDHGTGLEPEGEDYFADALMPDETEMTEERISTLRRM